MIDARGQESHFESWLTLNDGICDAIDALKALDKQKPIGQLCEEFYGRGQVMWFNKPVDGSYVYTTPPHTKVGRVECGVSGGHAFYCVACAKKLFRGYKESESFDRTASHMANEYVEYKEPILTDAEISESYYEVFKTAMIDIKAFEFAYSLLRKAQEK